MKKIIISGVLLLFISIYAYNQTYSSVVIYTPSNKAVNAFSLTSGDLTAQQKTDSRYFWLNCYSNRITYIDEATYQYNCHGYAWNVSSGGAKVWIESPEQKKYWQCGGSECGGYVEVSAADATKVSFGGPCYGYKTTCAGTSYSDWCDHSAITTSTSGTFRSKWGPAPAFQHAIADCPYTSSDLHYYALPVISGDGLLCYTSSHTYSVQDCVGVTYSWSTSSHLQINGSSTGRTVSVSPTSSSNMAEWIKVEITITAYNETVETTKTVWVGAPAVSITGPDEGCTYTSHTFRAQPTNYLSNPTSYSSWGIDPNDGYISTSGAGEYAYITFYNEYSVAGYDVEVKGTNTCGTGSFGYGNIWIYDCYYYAITPNPASDIVTINKVKASEDTDGKTILTKSDDENTTCDIQIIDYYGSLHLQTKKSGNSFTLPVSNLKDGTYFVKITNGNKTSSLKLVVKH